MAVYMVIPITVVILTHIPVEIIITDADGNRRHALRREIDQRRIKDSRIRLNRCSSDPVILFINLRTGFLASLQFETDSNPQFEGPVVEGEVVDMVRWGADEG
jgi:hypothetical protein